MKHAFELLITYFVVVFVLLVGVAATAAPGTRLAPSASLLQLLASLGFIQRPELNAGLNTFYLLLAVLIPPITLVVGAIAWTSACQVRDAAAEAAEVALIKYEEHKESQPDPEEEARQRRFAAYKKAYEEDQRARKGYLIEC